MRLLDKNYLADAIISNRLLSICGSLVLTALLGLGLQHLTFDPDFDTFFPENHPAREMQDTFFVERDPDVVLRTHTSNVQIRLMEQKKPPLRVIIPGRVYRNETVSSKSHCFFIK